MTSKITGRDYATLRSDIINFLRLKLPNDWDYQNTADPVVIFAECLARVGEELHFTIDELRRECDMATANRASSIYSYAMREGYKMMLPRASFGTLSINYRPDNNNSDAGKWHINIKKFDEIKVKPLGETLYVVDKSVNADLYPPLDSQYRISLSDYYNENGDINNTKRGIYNAYMEDEYSKTVRLNVVLGTKSEYKFTYSNINNDSTIELPDPYIDRNLVRLTYHTSSMPSDSYNEITYVDDVISSGFNSLSFTLTPKFIGGAIKLCIEFPTNYRDIFSDHGTLFTFEYIRVKETKIDSLLSYQTGKSTFDFGDKITYNDTTTIPDDKDIVVTIGNGIKGYTGYESANVTRENYKKFVQNYSALLTKSDYENYIKAVSSAHCKIYDHGDCYKSPPVLPDDTSLIPRVIYAVTDDFYDSRMYMWYDLKERSGRSDCIVMIPFGRDPYSVFIKAECYLVGTSTAEIATKIRNEIINYYDGSVGEKIPKISVIDYLSHKASDKVIRMESLIVRDTTFGTVDETFNNVNTLSNDKIDELFDALKVENINYQSGIEDDYSDGYYLRGLIYKDSNNVTYTAAELDELYNVEGTPKKVDLCYYCKYPRLKHGSVIDSEYNEFPDKFPDIYYLKPTHDGHDEVLITDYTDLVIHQATYGEVDTSEWDYPYSKIFSYNVTDTGTVTDTPEWYVYIYETSDHSDSAILYINSSDITLKSGVTNIYVKAEGVDQITLYTSPVEASYYVDSDRTTEFNSRSTSYSGDSPEGGLNAEPYIVKDATALINADYSRHHYMVPVINNVTVLIKAVNTNIR